MNKLTKLFLGAGAFLVMAGGLLALTGWAMGGETELETEWNGHRIYVGRDGITSIGGWEAAGGGHSGRQENLSLAAFDKLDVDVDLGDVLVARGADYGVSLEWAGRNYALTYELDGDTLRVRSRSVSGVNLNFSGYGGTAVVYVPEDAALERVELACGLGDVSVEDLSARSLSVDCDLGNMTLAGVAAGTLELEQSLGDITGTGLTVERSLTVDSDMGDTVLEGDLQGKIELKASMGDVELRLEQGMDCYACDLETDMGEITVNGRREGDRFTASGAPHSLEIDNSMGSVTVKFG